MGRAVCERYIPITFSCAPTCDVCSHYSGGRCKKEAVTSAANTDNGKAGFGMTSHFPASHNNKKIRTVQV